MSREGGDVPYSRLQKSRVGTKGSRSCPLRRSKCRHDQQQGCSTPSWLLPAKVPRLTRCDPQVSEDGVISGSCTDVDSTRDGGRMTGRSPKYLTGLRKERWRWQRTKVSPKMIRDWKTLYLQQEITRLKVGRIVCFSFSLQGVSRVGRVFYTFECKRILKVTGPTL